MKHLLIITIAAVAALGQTSKVVAPEDTLVSRSALVSTVIRTNVPDRIQIKYLFLALNLQSKCAAQGKDCEATRALLIPKVKAIFSELKQAGCDAGPVETRQIFEPLECK